VRKKRSGLCASNVTGNDRSAIEKCAGRQHGKSCKEGSADDTQDEVLVRFLNLGQSERDPLLRRGKETWRALSVWCPPCREIARGRKPNSLLSPEDEEGRTESSE